MEPALALIIYIVVMLAVSLAGAYLPFFRKLEDNQIHLLIALSAGIFLGILFFLLLPEAMHECHESGIEERYMMIAMIGGFLLILLVDVLIKHFHMASCPCECHKEEHRHKMGSLSAFVGLAVHAFFDGLLLTAGLMAGGDFGWMTLIGMCIHKFVELFSLSSTFLLSNEDKWHIFRYLFLFALISPIGAIISFLVFNGAIEDGIAGLPLAFSAGTFMYVSFCHMVPEAFHREHQDLRSFVLLMIGIAIAAAVFMLFGHAH